MTEVKFIQDYTAQGRIQIEKGAVYEIYDTETIKLLDGFINIYDIYDLEKRGIVETKQLS